MHIKYIQWIYQKKLSVQCNIYIYIYIYMYILRITILLLLEYTALINTFNIKQIFIHIFDKVLLLKQLWHRDFRE
jgi:hypothetical protein